MSICLCEWVCGRTGLSLEVGRQQKPIDCLTILCWLLCEIVIKDRKLVFELILTSVSGQKNLPKDVPE